MLHITLVSSSNIFCFTFERIMSTSSLPVMSNCSPPHPHPQPPRLPKPKTQNKKIKKEREKTILKENRIEQQTVSHILPLRLPLHLIFFKNSQNNDYELTKWNLIQINYRGRFSDYHNENKVFLLFLLCLLADLEETRNLFDPNRWRFKTYNGMHAIWWNITQ